MHRTLRASNRAAGGWAELAGAGSAPVEDPERRLQGLVGWLRATLPTPSFELDRASDDASFRRYYRIRFGGETRIAMDAPPGREDCRPFVSVAAALEALGLRVPHVEAADLARGFVLMTDLGRQQYLDALADSTVEGLYATALGALKRLQCGGDPASTLLPPYGAELLRAEMGLFDQWLVERHLGLTLDAREHATLDAAYALLCSNARAQPRVWVHRDYHSRNLMVGEGGEPGILDFQDAVIGPVTYDLVSLLRDCYLAWPRHRVEGWALAYRAELIASGMAGLPDEAAFMRWFDLMGVQRHLKAAGIFARLYLRDGKARYLDDVPRTLAYLVEVAARYPELAGLRDLLAGRVMPALAQAPVP